MKAISLWQPWATGIAIGVKPDETRGWPLVMPGGRSRTLAIHAAKRWNRELLEFCTEWPFYEQLTEAGYPITDEMMDQRPLACPVPLGAVVAVADVIACVPTERVRSQRTVVQLAWGDYSEGRFAWVLANVRRFKMHYPATGAQGLWDWTPPTGALAELSLTRR